VKLHELDDMFFNASK